MTSSSSYELTVRQRGRLIGSVAAGELDPHARAGAVLEADAHVPISIRVVRPPGTRTLGRVRVGDVVLIVLQPGQQPIEAATDVLREEYGEATLVYEEAAPEDPGSGYPLLELSLALRASPEIEALYERLVQDLEAVHAGLAQDVVSRTTHRAGFTSVAAAAIRPEADVERLSRLSDVLARALSRIGSQPSTALVRETRRGRWRAGERLRPAAVGLVVREAGTVVVEGRVRGLGKVQIDRTRTTTDTPEHRQLREGLRRLAARSQTVARQCRRVADLYMADRARWGRDRDFESSVFAKRTLPRVRVLEGFEERARSLAERFDRLTEARAFIAEAGPARSRLAPTPIFVNRPGYREAYGALREAETFSGALVEGEEVRLRYRQLSTLFEYWCFVKVVEIVRQQPGVGAPEPRDAVEVIDDVYRPELAPGQSFRFPFGRGRSITVFYEPDFPPDDRPTEVTHPFRAALSTAPLRPDITIQLDRDGEPPAILVLDAKSQGRFDPKTLWETTDYRTRIFDPSTGHQPVRQVFLLHRDGAAPSIVNLPGYLDQRIGDPRSSILGAVAFLPDKTESVRRVIERFVSVFG
jgi:hypothetical protein